MIAFVFAELADYAANMDPVNGIESSPVDGAFQSDGLVPEELRAIFAAHVEVLRKHTLPDWHPGTRDQVLDLVHPSLYPLVYGRTPLFGVATLTGNCFMPWDQFIGGGDAIATPAPRAELRRVGRGNLTAEYTISDHYQWLPSEVFVAQDGTAKFLSYINNLHPIVYAPLCVTIGAIFGCFVPLFERVLSHLAAGVHNRLAKDHQWWPDGYIIDDFAPEVEPIHPPVPLYAGQTPSVPLISLRNRQLQVIVKLADIVLTPDNPTYEGGTWHVEGMSNEKIVASGIYYYESSNVTESRLSFRHLVHEPENYEQNDFRGVAAVYGIVTDEPMNQFLGDIVTAPHRAVAFPNVYQHKVAPFQLLDATQPGRRQILVFFLVDPNCKITSTQHAPPQQQDWIVQANPLLKILPVELVADIVGKAGVGMTRTEAIMHREKLMHERKFFNQENSTMWFERPCSLCEH